MNKRKKERNRKLRAQLLQAADIDKDAIQRKIGHKRGCAQSERHRQLTAQRNREQRERQRIQNYLAYALSPAGRATVGKRSPRRSERKKNL